MLNTKWKWSHLILGTIFLSTIILAVSTAFYSSHHLSPKEPFRRSVWLIGKGPYFLDTITGHYKHLVVDFPLVELDPGSENLLTIEGYENGKRFLTTEIQNDTLYVLRAQPQSDTVIVAIDEDYAALVRVGAQSLRSITLRGSGHIDIPVNPYGSNPGGPIVYKPEDWEQYVLRNEILDLHLHDGAVGDFFLETDSLKIYISNSGTLPSTQNNYAPRRPPLLLIGRAAKTSVIHPEGLILIDAFGLRSDTVIVQSGKDPMISATGSITIHCSDFLEADLYHEMDVVYKGRPRIIKSERDFGRVIDGNRRL